MWTSWNESLKVQPVPEVSITLVTRGEDSLGEVISSIAKQTVEDYEVILAIDCPTSQTHLGFEGTKIRTLHLRHGAGLLEARIAAILAAKGLYTLLLDATRPIAPNCVAVLSTLGRQYDMIIVQESSLGVGRLVRAAGIDKRLVMADRNLQGAIAGRRAFAIPRFFRTDLLQSAAMRLKENLTPEILGRIRHGDHQLLFHECLSESRSVGACTVPVIAHYEDGNLGPIIKKYFGYGRSHRLLTSAVVPLALKGLKPYRRIYGRLSVSDSIDVRALHAVRGIAFLAGYLVGP